MLFNKPQNADTVQSVQCMDNGFCSVKSTIRGMNKEKIFQIDAEKLRIIPETESLNCV